MTTVLQSSKEAFSEAAERWNLTQLYEDLRKVRGKRIQDGVQPFLKGVLCRCSPAEIAERLGYSNRTVSVALSRGVYPYVKDLCKVPENQKISWIDIPKLLEKAGYLKTVTTLLGTAQSMSQHLQTLGPDLQSSRSHSESTSLGSVREFWDRPLSAGESISIQGSLSILAPMLIGPPKLKRETHRAYRRAVPPEQLQEHRTRVDSLLAFTAGQMVWNLELENTRWIYLGFYHSIVRNSIPVFVAKDYYARHVVDCFAPGNGCTRYVIEAAIDGIVQPLPDCFIREFIESNQLEDYIRPEILASGQELFGLFVDGQETQIKGYGASRYLDGDIWIALEHENKQFFVSRFVDLSDPEDVKREAKALIGDVEGHLREGARIICRFDNDESLFIGYHPPRPSDFIKRFTRK